MSIVVKPVSSRRERKQFLELPWTLYKGDANWIPPLRMNQRELVGYTAFPTFKRHPFYDDAEGQTFLALKDGQPVGRVMAILNNAHNRVHDERRGFFGFFESIDDQQVASGLFDAVRDWFAKRDIVQLRGPTNPTMNYECGLLVDGFNIPPTFMMTYNHPYYGRLLENWGFQKTQDLLSFWGHVDMIAKLDKKLAFIAQESQERFNIEIRTLNPKRFAEEIHSFLHIYNQSLGSTWGFSLLSEGEIKHMSASLKHMIIPDLALFACVDGKPVGSVFALPDYNPRIKQINGRLLPFGFLTLLNKKRGFRRFRALSTNVLPEYQRWGVALVLLRGLIPQIRAAGLNEAEFSWVLETNHLSRRSLEKGGAILEKTHRMYDYPAVEKPSA